MHLKVEAPRQSASVVPRPRLIAALDDLAGVRVLLLDAPAGFGKTTLLSQWRGELHRLGHRVAWLSLDRSDADARQLLIGMARALEVAGVELSRGDGGGDQGLAELTVETILRRVAATMAAGRDPVVLMLDDYHLASNPDVDRVIGRLVDLVPEHSLLILGSRQRPRWDVPRLIAAGTAAEITGDALRFTQNESMELLQAEVPGIALQGLIDRTEGWPVALQLARLAMRGGDAGRSLPQLTARGTHLSRFLTDQVLRGLSPEVVDFLLETSILERFNASMTDHLRDRGDGWEMLERLEALQSLLTPVDAEHVWFRYHHLFAEYLQSTLRQRHPERVAGLHLRASEACERAGLVGEAVRHASEAGDFDRCGALVERAGGWRLVLFGGAGQLRYLLGLIPDAEKLSRPRLLVAEAYLRMKEGRLDDAAASYDLVSAATRSVPRDDLSGLDDLERDVLNVGLLKQGYEDNGLDAGVLRAFRSQRASLPGSDGLTRGILDCASAIAALRLGALGDAEAFAREAMGEMRSVNSVLGLNYCFLHAGSAAMLRGELRTAAAYLVQARGMAAENFGNDSGLKAMSDLLLAAVRSWLDEPSHERADLEASFRHVCDYDGWFDIYAAGLDTRFRAARAARDPVALQAVIDDGAAIADARGLRRLQSIVEAQRLLHACMVGDDAGADAIAARLSRNFPLGCWRTAPETWRPYHEVSRALALWGSARDRRSALDRAEDAIRCAAEFGARPHEIEALLMQAELRHGQGRAGDAAADLARAVALAAPDRIAQPFRRAGKLAPLLADLQRSLWRSGGDPVQAAFLSEVTAGAAPDDVGEEGPAAGLSAREREVVRELALGSTNKEIARALDMTEHTVKFHLKNVFTKLRVDRRAHVLSALRERGWNDPI